jgi:homoserine O-acetyltransferase/O-succinyltransferase
LQFKQVNNYIIEFPNVIPSDIMDSSGCEEVIENGVGVLTKTIVFGEAEAGDITAL